MIARIGHMAMFLFPRRPKQPKSRRPKQPNEMTMTMLFFNATAEAAARRVLGQPRRGLKNESISPTPWACSGRGTNLG